jgi:hypothetical protein
VGPRRTALQRDLLSRVNQTLSSEERRILELRIEGHTWPEVAAALGGTAEARRKQFQRAVAPLGHELGLEGDENG